MLNKMLRLLLFSLSITTCCLCVAADNNKTEEPKPQKSYAPYPQPDAGYITDNAKILTRSQEENLEKKLFQTEKKTGVEVVVVTIDSIKDYPGTANSSIEKFATGLFNKYGIGNKKKNDGVLLLIAYKDRKARIELGGGYGHSRDSDATKIMNGTIIPAFKAGKYDKGLIDGTYDLIEEFAGLRFRFAWEIVIIPVVIIFLGFLCYNLFKKGKTGWGWVVLVVIGTLLFWLIQVIITVLSSESSGTSGGFGGGFGGGSSGGGGATGSW